MYNEAAKYLSQMLGEGAEFRSGQWEAIDLALHNKKALIVQQTGWGDRILLKDIDKVIFHFTPDMECKDEVICMPKQPAEFFIRPAAPEAAGSFVFPATSHA